MSNFLYVTVSDYEVELVEALAKELDCRTQTNQVNSYFGVTVSGCINHLSFISRYLQKRNKLVEFLENCMKG